MTDRTITTATDHHGLTAADLDLAHCDDPVTYRAWMQGIALGTLDAIDTMEKIGFGAATLGKVAREATDRILRIKTERDRWLETGGRS